LLSSLLVGSLTLVARAPWAEVQPPATSATDRAPVAADPAVRSVIDDYIQALGGREALWRIRNRRAEGVIEQGHSRKKFLLYWAAPNLARAEFKQGDFVIYNGYDGRKGWSQESFAVTEQLKPEELLDLLLYADPLRYARLLELYSDVVVEADPPDRAGRTVLREKVNGFTVRLFFDRKTHLLTEIESGSDHAEAAPRRSQLEEYRRVDGILFPFVIHEIIPIPNLDPAAIRIEQLVQFKSVKHNVPNISPALFEEPR
jgi:hypothetical protein